MAEQSSGSTDVNDQAAQQTGQQVRLRLDERNMTTSYANAFRSHATAEEVLVDFGLNLLQQTPGTQTDAGGQSQPNREVLFQANDRIVMNYYTAKRLAIALGQLVQRHEQQFGELKLNAQERRQQPSSS